MLILSNYFYFFSFPNCCQKSWIVIAQPFYGLQFAIDRENAPCQFFQNKYCLKTYHHCFGDLQFNNKLNS